MSRRLAFGVLVAIAAVAAVQRAAPMPDPWITLGFVALLGFTLGLTLVALLTRAWRRAGLGLVGLTLLLAAFLGLPPAPAVVVIVIDCLGANRFDAQNMPQTWAFAQTGWRWEYALAQSSWTRSSVASILTGQFPIRHRLYRLKPTPDRLPDDVPTLAEALLAGGVATGLFAEQAQLDPAFGLGRGFLRYGNRDGDATGIQRRFDNWNLVYRHTPRFAYLHYLDIHKPYRPDPAFVGELPPDTLGLATPADWTELMRAINAGERTLTDPEWRRLEGLHVATIRQLDVALGALWERLSLDGTLDRSWVILTADHGEAFGEHGWFTHGGPPHAELVQVPLVIRPPGGRPAGSPAVRAGHPRQVDLAPTVVALAGLQRPADLPGVELLTALPETEPRSEASIAEYYGGAAREIAVRMDTWSLLRGPHGDRLYDLTADPGEHTDVAAAHLVTAARLGRLADAYLAGAADGRSASGVDPGTTDRLRELGYLE